jgi:hypothetical protein
MVNFSELTHARRSEESQRVPQDEADVGVVEPPVAVTDEEAPLVRAREKTQDALGIRLREKLADLPLGEDVAGKLVVELGKLQGSPQSMGPGAVAEKDGATISWNELEQPCGAGADGRGRLQVLITQNIDSVQ